MSWYEAIKDLARIGNKVQDAELHEAIANLKMEGAQLAEENAQLREEVVNLRAKVAQRDEMFFHENAYWRRRGEEAEGPFCPRCFPEKDIVARLTNTGYGMQCPVCHQFPQRIQMKLP